MNKINFAQRDAIYTKAIKTWGEEAQMVVALEEMSELQKEVCKAIRGNAVLEHIAEEIADATIMIEQLRKIFGVNELVCSIMDQKIRRLEKRLAKEEKGTQEAQIKNGEWLRSLQDEDLAQVLYFADALEYCNNDPECEELLDTEEGIPEEKCKACLTAWLKKEKEQTGNG